VKRAVDLLGSVQELLAAFNAYVVVAPFFD
jgi:hypothetical protein